MYIADASITSGSHKPGVFNLFKVHVKFSKNIPWQAFQSSAYIGYNEWLTSKFTDQGPLDLKMLKQGNKSMYSTIWHF